MGQCGMTFYRSIFLGVLALIACSTTARADAPAPCEKADAACDAAITAATDPHARADLLFRRAFARDAARDVALYPTSLKDLADAIQLDPNNAQARHERGFLYNEMGRWADARDDLTAQISIAPNEASGYRERALARFNLGDLKGAYEDRDKVVQLAPSGTAFLSRARAGLWLGKFAEAGADIAKANAYAKDDARATNTVQFIRAELDLWKSTSAEGAKACDPDREGFGYDQPYLIGDCTRAFLDAANDKERAAALATRSVAWVAGLQDETAFTVDCEIAVMLDPKDAALRANLGFAYIRVGHPAAAIPEFDAAIAAAPDFANYAGRAQARLAIGDLDGAEADANKSIALQANTIAYVTLGDIAYARTKTYDKAKDYWMKAYEAGPPDEQLLGRLKAAGVVPPAPQKANAS